MRRNKIFSVNRLVKEISFLKRQGKKIVFTNGCFDILHRGHISYLNKARQLGDILIVALNSDSSVKSIKGRKRPLNTLKDRQEVIACLECVDYVCSFNQTTPLQIIKKIKPDILVKGGDWKNKVIAGSEWIKKHGGKVITITYLKKYSTSNLIKRISCLK